MTVTLTLGTIIADGGAYVTRTGHGWGLQNISDWMSLPSSKAEVYERPQSHGSFDVGTDWRQSASFTVTLAYMGVSIADLDEAIIALTGLASSTELITCIFDDGNYVTTRLVSIRKIDVPSHRGRKRLQGITVDLLAPDPFAYGASSSASTGLPAPGGGVAFPVGFPVGFGAVGVDGRARFINEGTAPTSLRFRVSGGFSDGFSLRCVESGDVLTFRRPVASDDYVLLDSSDGSALLNGVSPVSGYLTDDDWWQVGPGETCTVQFTSLGGVQGSPLLVLSGSPAYF